MISDLRSNLESKVPVLEQTSTDVEELLKELAEKVTIKLISFIYV